MNREIDKKFDRNEHSSGHTFTPAYRRADSEVSSSQRNTAFRRRLEDDDKGRGRNKAGGSRNKDSGNKNKGKRLLILIMIVAEIFALIAIGAAWYGKRAMSMLQTDTEFMKEEMTNPYISVDKEEAMKGYWTVALFGVDSRDNSVGKGNMADVIIICNINQETGAIKLVSVFRDTYLNVDENGSYNKINQAYFKGGPKQAVEALNRNLDLEIDDYATFNWKAVADAVNILGGVDVELSKAEFYYINGYITETVKATGVASVHLKSAGPNHLDGVQAVAYARLRKMDTDFARTERQRKVIQLSFDKMKKANFSVVNNVMVVVFPQIMTSVTMDDILPAAMNLTKYHIADTMGFPDARTDVIMGKKGDCVIPQTLESNVISLHKFLFDDEDYVPSNMVKKISSKISSDSGMYKEGKPVGDVGTDGGVIPKATSAEKTNTVNSDESKKETSESETDETKESVIDGEYIWELETDEDGNIIDPPEDYYDYGTNSFFGTPIRRTEAETREDENETQIPGETTVEGDTYAAPGDTTKPGGINYPGGTIENGGSSNTGPGSSRNPSSVMTEPTGSQKPMVSGSAQTTPGEDISAPGTGPVEVQPEDHQSGPGNPFAQTQAVTPSPTTAVVNPAGSNGGPSSVITGPGQ